MLKSYLLIAWRSLIKNRVYSAINLFGLAIGMAVVLLNGLWVQDELGAGTARVNPVRALRAE
jgi:putative ABC transport system permease protein